MSATTEEKAEAFRALHAGDAFVIPNPWDAGSARVLAALGFRALATTSSGFAFTLGRLDGAATLDEVVDHAAVLARATDLPVSVDLEDGHGADPGVAIFPALRRRARSVDRSRTGIESASTALTKPSSGFVQQWPRHGRSASRSR